MSLEATYSDSKGRTLHTEGEVFWPVPPALNLYFTDTRSRQGDLKKLTKEKLRCQASPSEVFEKGQPNRLEYSTWPWTQTTPAQSPESQSLRSASSTVLSDWLTGSPRQLDKTQGQLKRGKSPPVLYLYCCFEFTQLNQSSSLYL